MSILGVGTDIIELDRIKNSIETHGKRFLARLFTEKEQAYCLNYKDAVPHFAARFAAKEAIAKALGTGIGAHLSWTDLEIINDDAGKPVVRLSVELQEKLGNTEILLSFSHCHAYATAVALWVRHGEGDGHGS